MLGATLTGADRTTPGSDSLQDSYLGISYDQSIIDTRQLVIGTCKSIIDTCGPHPPNSPTFRGVCSCIHTKRPSLYASVESDSDDAPRQCAQTIIALRTHRHVTRSSVCVLNLRGYVRRRGAHMIQSMLVVRYTAHMGWT